jgi:hypothetical protein
MDSEVTAWSGGQFSQVEEPEWWNSEAECVSYEPYIRIGVQEAVGLEVYQISEPFGWILVFYARGSGRLVWCPTAADFFDIMTARVPAWCGLAIPPMKDD